MKNKLNAVKFKYQHGYTKTVFNAGLIIMLLFGLLELAFIQLNISPTSQSIFRIIVIGQIWVLSAIASAIIHTLRLAIAETSYSRIRGIKPGYIIVGLLFGINSITSGLTSINSSGIAIVITAFTSILFILAAIGLFRRPKTGVKIGFGVSTLLLGIMILSLYHQPQAFNVPVAQFNAILMTYFYPLIKRK